ncbi:outer membrane beta-barrel protein [Rosistilla oblonga]|uniref:outer membrane beta-barrel protein n=1 Tax=Rosistilla oblonga TaxID=2527990 RepID=UPI003A978478
MRKNILGALSIALAIATQQSVLLAGSPSCLSSLRCDDGMLCDRAAHYRGGSDCDARMICGDECNDGCLGGCSDLCGAGCDHGGFGCDAGMDSCCDGGLFGLGLLGQASSGWNVSGWVDAGFIGNTSSPNSKFNGPYNAVDRSNEGMLNQLYMIVEKRLPRYGAGIGGRVDILYGEDYLLAQSNGLERRDDGAARWNGEYYGLALPQAYVSMGNEDVSLQVGHFYSVVGYEGVMAPDNFFYSKSYSYQFAGPFTHWGAQLNVRPTDALSFNLGIHNGWDSLDRESDKPGFIGKVRYDSQSSKAWTSFAITTGDSSNDLAGVALNPDFTNRTRYSWLVALPVTKRLDYVFHHWLGFQEEGAPDGGRADWYGIDQYLTYCFTDRLKGAVRFEWFRDEEGTRVGLNRPSNPNNPPFVGDFYSLSAGFNMAVSKNLTIRPELRADWFDGTAASQPFDDGNDDNQFMLGIDAIFRI